MIIRDIVYIEKIEGREKPKYHNVGVLIEKDDGKMSIKLATIPVGAGFAGWLNVFEQKAKDDHPNRGGHQSDPLEPF